VRRKVPVILILSAARRGLYQNDIECIVSQLGNFVKDNVVYQLCPRDAVHSYCQHWLREPAGHDVIIAGDLYRITAVDSRLKFTFDTTGDHPPRTKRSSAALSSVSRDKKSTEPRRNYLVEMVLVIDYVIYYRYTVQHLSVITHFSGEVNELIQPWNKLLDYWYLLDYLYGLLDCLFDLSSSSIFFCFSSFIR